MFSLDDRQEQRVVGDPCGNLSSRAHSRSMHATNLLKKVLKPRNLTPTPAQNKENASSKRSSSAGTGDSGRPTCTCSPTNHAGSFRCRLHRRNGGGRSHGLTPAAMAKPEGPKKPFKGSSSYTISSVDIHAPLGRPTISRALAAPSVKNKHRGKPSRLSRMAKASPASAATEDATAKKSGAAANEDISGPVDEHLAAGEDGLVHAGGQDHCQSSTGAYDFDSDLYRIQQPRESQSPLGGMQSPKPTPRGSDFQCDASEMYTRLYAAQQTTDFISSTEVDALYGASPKTTSNNEDVLKDRKLTADALEDDWIPVVDAVPEVEESKLYVEPLRIIDFKQHFFGEATYTSFLVQWENLSVRDATWESSHFISGYPQLLKDFLQRRSEQGDSVDFFLAMENVKNVKSTLGSEKHESQDITPGSEATPSPDQEVNDDDDDKVTEHDDADESFASTTYNSDSEEEF